MEVMSDRTIKIQLNMNEREARWLKNLVQNYEGNDEFGEGKPEQQMREDLFNALRLELGDN